MDTKLPGGAFDLHTHGYPEIRPGFGVELDDVAMAECARSRGMAGYVLKSHLWPTMDRAYHIHQQVDGIRVVPSVVLNSLVGGIQAGVLETAITQGAGAAWFPTWSSANDLTRGGFSARLKQMLPGLEALMKQGLTVLNSVGGLTPEARDVLRVAKEHEIVLGTGHLSGKEAVALADAAQHIGYERLIFTHPDSHSVDAADEDIVEAAKCGAYIEWRFIGTLRVSPRIGTQQVVEWIARIGADRCVLTSDTFGGSSLPEPDIFRSHLGALRDLGVVEEDLRKMAVYNPQFLVGMTDCHRSE